MGAVNDRYRHRPGYYAGRVDLFSANKPDDLGRDFNDSTMGWGSVVGGGIQLYQIPGEHLQIIKPPLVNDLALEVRKRLDVL